MHNNVENKYKENNKINKISCDEIYLLYIIIILINFN